MTGNIMKILTVSVMLSLVCVALAADDAKGPKPKAAGSPTRVLIVGGGSSHDFNRWFNHEDVKTLSEASNVVAQYTDKPAEVTAALKEMDVLYLSSNQPFDVLGLHEGIFDFAKQGKGLLLVHPALWYNWKDWPEYNRDLVGGGSKSHDKLGEFEVTVVDAAHPLMVAVPEKFTVFDELYHFQPDASGAKLHVLATGKSPTSGKVFPVAWITEHPKARIACLTLGHDGRAHEHPAYKAILRNAAQWVANRP